MSGIIDIHTEILNEAQGNLLHDLSKIFMNSDYYLAGGTALALKLGHRLSKDFVDLYYLIKNFKPIEAYQELYIKKFKNRDIGHVIRSLAYFRDSEAEPELTMIAPFD
jgi:hypothetical protein